MVSPARWAPPRYLTVAEVAALVRVSKMTVYRLVHAGTLEAARIGRSFRVPEPAVRRDLTGQEVTDPLDGGEFALVAEKAQQ